MQILSAHGSSRFKSSTTSKAMKKDMGRVVIYVFCCVWIEYLALVKCLVSYNRRSTSSSRSDANDFAGRTQSSQSVDRIDDDTTVDITLKGRRYFLKHATNMFMASAIASFAPSSCIAADTTPGTGGVKVSKRAGGLAQKIRGGVCFRMDELQRDLMQERWDLLPAYPSQLRSYVPLFTTYTDAAFPSELPSDYGLRVALRYEVGRFFAAVERLKRAIALQALDEAYTAYAEMSLHLDRYLRVGGLYTYYDSVIDNEQFFQDYNDALVYSDPVKDPADVRDLIVLCKGPDKGKTGIVIGFFPNATNDCVVKLDRYRGMREIRVVPRSWAAKRLGEQDPDDVFLIPLNSDKHKGSRS